MNIEEFNNCPAEAQFYYVDKVFWNAPTPVIVQKVSGWDKDVDEQGRSNFVLLSPKRTRPTMFYTFIENLTLVPEKLRV